MIVEGICVVIAVYCAVRAVFEPKTLKKLPYLNVMNFAVAGTIVLLIPHPITVFAAIAYFIGSTLESNAIASTFAQLEGE
ncbi:MAG: DUF2109 domain-containing protein [Methanocorpusculum sp.]|jgi:energy-converting hydrogenase A subunit C|uniref:DUF2109 domain-containing protein n=1 Tax=Methanocorpusculum sp. TaxID=2058474 RepID=UPI002A592E93|nr:DUF2109 domain-containing protein [Methanocorpusculum sp.]MDD3046597.1 DUF2109 domain-containing protein [Methanocorpusculum sp.]MDY3201792.1 DUF2109 domain-containing protein [Methanocorpusculum sp.]MEA5086588.1 DUF2109 domain-containing protein [Methanocorpusculum sp.]